MKSKFTMSLMYRDAQACAAGTRGASKRCEGGNGEYLEDDGDTEEVGWSGALRPVFFEVLVQHGGLSNHIWVDEADGVDEGVISGYALHTAST